MGNKSSARKSGVGAGRGGGGARGATSAGGGGSLSMEEAQRLTGGPNVGGTSIKSLEKTGGPYIPGVDPNGGTVVSAIRQVTSGKDRGTYIGVVGNVKDASFQVTFPRKLRLATGSVVKGLDSSGPQGNQGRRFAYEAAKAKK